MHINNRGNIQPSGVPSRAAQLRRWLIIGEEGMYYTRSTAALGLALASGFLLGGGVTDAAAQSKHFRGSACLISATAACASVGWKVGDCGNVRFVPPNWNGSGNQTKFSFHWNYFAQHYSYNGSLVGTVFRPVQVGNIGSSHYSYTGSTARVTGQVPASPAAGAPLLSNTIFITPFDDIPGCNIALRFQGQRYPLP